MTWLVACWEVRPRYSFVHYILSISRFKPPQYEDALRKAEDLEHSQGQARARVVLLYYSSRMEAVSTCIEMTWFSAFQYQHGTFH